jgi:hypothetical protein
LGGAASRYLSGFGVRVIAPNDTSVTLRTQ